MENAVTIAFSFSTRALVCLTSSIRLLSAFSPHSSVRVEKNSNKRNFIRSSVPGRRECDIQHSEELIEAAALVLND
jgi:hypothetical protein